MRKVSRGKVRDIYEASADTLMIVVSDRISAFDVIMNDFIHDKGRILNLLSEFWFDFTSGIVKNHMITTDSEKFPTEFQTEEFRGRSMLVRKLKMLPFECIVRGYITGSGWTDYKATGGVCGIALPEGLSESQKLDKPLFTPSTKAELGAHDENISFERTCEMLGDELASRVREKSFEVYTACADFALKNGIIIADTKFEFGLDENGELILGDEVLTPDSSRFWPLDKYEVGKTQESFDKQPLRDWLASNGYRDKAPEHLPDSVIDMTRALYIEAFEKITGKIFS